MNSDKPPTRVLLVEDSAVYRHLITRRLSEWQFEVVVVDNGTDAWSALHQPDTPKLVLLDWIMPGMDGLELCRKLRGRDSSESYIYIVLLTGKDARGDLLQAMEAGADDYLVKPFDELELKARLLAGKRILDLHDELISAREAMCHGATHDALTGLLNRGEILDMLRRELARSKREHKPTGIVLADVDRFIAINDELGHVFGDEALKAVARRLQTQLRIYDGVGRYGGEEFLLVLPGCDLASILVKADNIRAEVASAPVAARGAQRAVTVSMGVAVVDGTADIEVESFLNRADLGLYEAKNRGRNRVEHVEPHP